MIVTVLATRTPLPPVTQPEVPPTVATAVLLLLHVPPVLASVRQSVVPAHNGAFPPEMPEGRGFTVVVVYAAQPVGAIK